MKKLSYLLLFISSVLQAQNIEFEKANFPDKKDQLKEAKRSIETGDDIMKGGEFFYKQAIPHYLKANEFNPNNAQLNFKLGVCYLNSPERAAAAKYFDAAYKLNPKVDPIVLYYEGYSHHLNADWDFAIKEYQEYKETITQKDPNYEKTIKRITECKNAKQLTEKPVRVFIDNIGNVVNTRFNEYGPVISADEDVMIFTSRREGTTGGRIDEVINEPMEDIYVSYMFNNNWTKPVNLGEPINSTDHDAVVAISPDGQRLIVYNGAKNRGDLFISELEGEKWSKPEALPKPINSDAHEPSASISFDGNTIFFVSDRESGSLGGHDIYMCTKDVKGKWGKAVNLGPTINTPYNEEAVFVMADGKTLYFSSEGHNSMGGYDIFKTTFENGIWTTPENIGWPINTPDNDVFFVLAANGRNAYYASASKDGLGGQDIYKITILGPEKQPLLSTEDNLLASLTAPVSEVKVEKAVAVKSPQVTLLKGIITDEQTKLPLEASIELIDNTKNEIIAVFASNKSSGKYLVSLPSGKNYGIAVKKDGYLFHSENFDLPATADYQEVNKDVALKKIDIGKSIVLRNIFFDFDKSSIRPESANELDRLIKLLNDNYTLRIELGSHTDSKGSDDYNMKLSENRSKSVVDYLITKGIAANRLEAKGYGETKPIATNDTDAGRQENRRTEFKILSK